MASATTTTTSYLQRLSNVIASLPAFTKDTSGYNYKYVTLDSIQKTLTPLLAENQLVLIHTLGFVGTGEERVNGVTSSVLSTDELNDIDVSAVSSFFPIKHNQSPQDVGSARTYGMRYNVTALFNIILVGEDDDGASASKKSGGSGGGKKQTSPARDELASADTSW
jgi:hypothetical protein